MEITRKSYYYYALHTLYHRPYIRPLVAMAFKGCSQAITVVKRNCHIAMEAFHQLPVHNL
jgi:hypothetical protein